MGWKMTPEERRIIERTKREGEEYYAARPEEVARRKARLWKNALVWAAVIVVFVIVAMLMVYSGFLFGQR